MEKRRRCSAWGFSAPARPRERISSHVMCLLCMIDSQFVTTHPPITSPNVWINTLGIHQMTSCVPVCQFHSLYIAQMSSGLYCTTFHNPFCPLSLVASPLMWPPIFYFIPIIPLLLFHFLLPSSRV